MSLKNRLWMIFNKKKSKQMGDDFLKYLEVVYDGNSVKAHADITNEDIKNWMYAVTHSIQKSFSNHPIIENYLSATMIIAGQKIEFAFVKEGKEGPHKMRMLLEEENKKLKEKIKQLELKND